MRDFGLSYYDVGLLMSIFFVISGSGQAMSGFVVDRIGARPVLFAAIGCFLLASLAASMATGYAGLVMVAVLAGLGNAPFHPADFTILNQQRLLGWARRYCEGRVVFPGMVSKSEDHGN